MKILSLDVGSVKVGLAIGVLPEKIALPVGVFLRRNGEAEKEIFSILTREGIEEIIVGLPFGVDGVENEQCLKVRAFCRRLERRVRVKISFVDEYLSSEEAADELVTTKEGRGALDALAAVVILKRFFNSVSK